MRRTEIISRIVLAILSLFNSIAAGAVSFSTPSAYSIGAYVDAVAVADFNGDAHADLALAISTSRTVVIMAGNRIGGFSQQEVLDVPGAPHSLIAADLNGDGHPDLAITSRTAVMILLGNGSGGFARPISLPVSADTIGTGHINGDDVTDLVLGRAQAPVVLWGDPSGTFQTSTTLQIPMPGGRISIADMNADGFDDLLLDNRSILLARNNTVEGFDAPTTLPALLNGGLGPWSLGIAPGDFNGDGRTDIAIAVMYIIPVGGFPTGGGAQLLLQNIDDDFTTPSSSVATSFYSALAHVADFNGDGKDDVLSGYGQLALGGGAAGLAAATTGSVVAVTDIYAIADINHDGLPDVIGAHSLRPGQLLVALNTSDCFGLSDCTEACDYTFSPNVANFSRSGGNGSFKVEAPQLCSWTLGTDVAWIAEIIPPGGTGNGTVAYHVIANDLPGSRTGTITVGGATFAVQQDSLCTPILSPSRASFTHEGGTGGVAISLADQCAWTAKSEADWITLGQQSGDGPISIFYTVAANPGIEPRIAAIDISGQAHTVLQTGVSPDLGVTWLAASSSCQGKKGNTRCKIKATIKLHNGGPSSALPFRVRVFLRDAGAGGQDLLLKDWQLNRLRAKETKIKKLSRRLPLDTSASGKQLLVAIDPDNVNHDDHPADNTALIDVP